MIGRLECRRLVVTIEAASVIRELARIVSHTCRHINSVSGEKKEKVTLHPANNTRCSAECLF